MSISLDGERLGVGNDAPFSVDRYRFPSTDVVVDHFVLNREHPDLQKEWAAFARKFDLARFGEDAQGERERLGSQLFQAEENIFHAVANSLRKSKAAAAAVVDVVVKGAPVARMLQSVPAGSDEFGLAITHATVVLKFKNADTMCVVLDPNNSSFSASLQGDHDGVEWICASNTRIYRLPPNPVTGRQPEHHRDCVDLAIKLARRFLVADGECCPPTADDISHGSVSFEFVRRNLTCAKKITNNNVIDCELPSFIHTVSWRDGQASDLEFSDDARRCVRSLRRPLMLVGTTLGSAARDACVLAIKSQLLSRRVDLGEYQRVSSTFERIGCETEGEAMKKIIADCFGNVSG